MHKDKRILAVIPARGGSKGLPGKNIRQLAGKPLIAWSINAARQSKYVDEVIVSTDCAETARIAKACGGNVPFIRPSALATDEAKGIDVIVHALDWRNQDSPQINLVLVLQPTSPLRTYQDIDQAIELLFKKKARSVVSVCPVEHHPWWTNVLPDDGCLENFIRPEILRANRQELKKYYRLNGAIYLADTSLLTDKRSFISKDSFAYIMDIEKSIDIDSMIDFKLAEILLMELKQKYPTEY